MIRLFGFLFPALLLAQQRFDVPRLLPDIMATDPPIADPAHCRVVLENEQVRVLRFRLGPREKSPAMVVPAHVLVAITDQHLRLWFVHDKPKEQQHKAGDSAWAGRNEYALENLSDKPVEWILIETKDKGDPAR